MLAYDGNAPVSIVDGRHRFGLAYQHDRGVLTLACFGEWSRHNAGGTEIRAVLRVPAELEIEQRRGLAGRRSEANADPLRDIDVAAVEQRRQSPDTQEKLAKLRERASDPAGYARAMMEDPSKLQDLMEAQRELMKDLYGIDVAAPDADDDLWGTSRLRAGWQAIATELDPAHTAAAWMPTLVASPGIVLGEQRGRVVNGTAFERATIHVPAGVQVVEVPAEASVQTIASEGRIEVYLQKVLSYYGHPPKPMSIITSRHEMGVSAQQQTTRLAFVTFGEWASIEGGMNMRMLFRVPAGLSIGRAAEVVRHADTRRFQDFEGAEPPTEEVLRPGSLVIATELDPEHTARQAVTPAETRKQWLATLDLRALRTALWALKSGLDRQQLAAYVRNAPVVDLGGCLTRCLEQLAPLSMDPELARHLAAGSALLGDLPQSNSDPRWAAKLQQYAHIPQLAARVTAMGLWASEVGDWFRSVMELLPDAMPSDDYFEEMASLGDEP